MKSDPLITYRRKPATLDTASLESFAEVLRKRVARGREFHCRITNDAELQSLNARFLGKDYPTDVLSFPSATGSADTGSADTESAHAGDIAISLQRARAQAREWDHTPEEEIRILMLHGLLHLLGMDHESDNGRMRRAELRWRRTFELPNGLIERVSNEKERRGTFRQ
jgi:probable rRNA maturation factor